MSVNLLAKELSVIMKRWFGKRNIIIVSQDGVRHVPVGGASQLGALIVALAFICWASFSTGSYMAARSALKEQGQTLRDVTSAYVSKTMQPGYRPSEELEKPPSPLFTQEALQNQRMMSHVAYLEHKVDQLKTTNAEIIQRVQEKTSDKIDDLEQLIRQTGLDATSLKKQAGSKPSPDGAQGGPYIPADMRELQQSKNELFSSLDELAALSNLIDGLPLSTPLPGGKPQSGFGHRYDPFTNRLAFHAGLDLAGPDGAKVRSTADGVVAYSGWNGAYGNMIEIDHGRGISTRYGHLSKLRVVPGQQVNRGDWIGVQGSTGRSTGPHLHYEVRYRNEAMNPKKFLEAGRYVSEKL
ncbi:MAG: M23 family metallopeptidase [Alphaproteobacteria bacterium]|nr:M23 family metallopeptidase [Alphaproteobacteria bacterium]